jgi:hypothetical protein
MIFIPTGGLFGEHVFPDVVKGGDNLLLLFGQLKIHWLIILLIEGLSNLFARCSNLVEDRVHGFKRLEVIHGLSCHQSSITPRPKDREGCFCMAIKQISCHDLEIRVNAR